MGKVSVQEIKELMKSTGVGMMDCKNALVESDGDVEKAITYLREKGLATQAKKADRVAAEGIVMALTNKDNTVLYTGVTSDLEKRIIQHRDKTFGGFSARYNLGKLVYFEEWPNITSAIQREKAIKRLSRQRKISLIEKLNPYWKELIEDKEQ